MALPVIDLAGTPGDMGMAHGRVLADQLAPAWLDAFLQDFEHLNRLTRAELYAQAEAWQRLLPGHVLEEIDGMARGARAAGASASRADVLAYLYADIAQPTLKPGEERQPAGVVNPAAHGEDGAEDGVVADEAGAGGPMCSGLVVPTADDGALWVARNCDWYWALLRRGTAVVVHRRAGAIPCMALGVFGDIDVDTGVNAAGLWLHMHTLYSTDGPRAGTRETSWLFWCREMLETCETLADVERFIERTSRDRGVLLFAVEGRLRRAALFECTRGSHVRHEMGAGLDGDAILATNHCPAKVMDAERVARSRRGSTVSRLARMRALVEERPEHGPDDLIDVLADPGVEMRRAKSLRTIYAAACAPGRQEVWIASAGYPEGGSAASAGRWERVGWPF